MRSAIALRTDFTGSELRQLARYTRDANQARRLLAFAVIYDGGSRSEAARVAHREVPEAKPMQQLADAALMQMHAKRLGDLPAEIAAAPAHHAVCPSVRSRADPARDVTLLRRRQLARCAPAVRAVEQAANAISVVAVNPIPQRLAIHTRLTRRLLSTMSLQQQRYRQHPTRCVSILRATSLPSQIRSRQLQPRDLHRHRRLAPLGDNPRITPIRAAPIHA
jgi:hypothetical protein